MPGSAPAGGVGAIGRVAPVAPDAPASPGSSLAEAGTANTRIRTTVAKAVAGAVDRRRDDVVVVLPRCARPRRLQDGSANVDPVTAHACAGVTSDLGSEPRQPGLRACRAGYTALDEG